MATARQAQREYPIIDFSGHLLTRVPEVKAEIDTILGPIHTDPDRVRSRYDAAGVDQVVLSQPPTMGSPDLEITRQANNDLLAIVENYDAFYGLAGVPGGAGGTAAADEFERCIENGFHGGALETMSSGTELTDPALEPVLEVANQTGAPLLVHPKLFRSLQPDPIAAESDHTVLTDEYKLNAIFGREAALAESICKVIHTGLLDRYSNLNLVYHHFGGNIAAMMGRIHLQLDPGRFPGQDQCKSYEEFRSILERRVFVDTAGFFGHHAAIRTALDVFPSTQILFGTDAPYEPRSDRELERHWSSITEVSSRTDQRRILSDNAHRLLVNT